MLRKKDRKRCLAFEGLENRKLLIATAQFVGASGLLDINGDGGDNIVFVDTSAGNVRVFDGNTQLTITGGAPAPASVNSIDVDAGGGQDYIDLSFVTTGNGFSGLNNNITVNGDGSDDVIFGSGFDDDLDGDGGNDEIHGGPGDDSINGGTSSRADFLFGDDGDDTLVGGNSDDWLDGGKGNDTLNGGVGNDTYGWTYDSSSTMYTDTITESNADAGDNANDTITFQGWNRSVNVDLSGAANQVVTTSKLQINGLGDIENVLGGSGADEIDGDSGVNVLDGGGGNDTVDGNNGADILVGGQGDDVVFGGTSDDIMLGDGFGYFSNVGLHDNPTGVTLDEGSGIVASRRSSSLLWSIEDSGNGANVFINTTGGDSRGFYSLSGVTNTDFEDIAAWTSASGTPQIFVGDIGDNGNSRADIQIHRFDEPVVSGTGTVSRGSLTAVGNGLTTLTLDYPTGAPDAETLMVDPLNGDIYVVEKSGGNLPNLYQVTAANQTWNNTTAITMTDLGTFGSLNVGMRMENGSSGVGGVPPSGGDISADGTQIVLSSETAVFRYNRLPGDSIFQALDRGPVEIVDAFQTGDREGITFATDGDDIYTSSEQKIESDGVNAPALAAQHLRRYSRFGGHDALHGDDGDDLMIGGSGDDAAYGGDGDDHIFGDLVDKDAYSGYGYGDDELYGMDDDDTLRGGTGGDYISGGNDVDVLFALIAQDDSEDEFDGVDSLYGGLGVDTLHSNASEDSETA